MMIDDLEVGDVLLKYYDGSTTNKVIAAGQAVFSHNLNGGHCDITHAALYVGDNRLVEATGDGLCSNVLTSSHYLYEVYRYRDPALRQLAADVGREFQRRAMETDGAVGRYNVAGSATSVVRSSRMGRFGRNALATLTAGQQSPEGLANACTNMSFYCSNFVVFAYNSAAKLSNLPLPINVDFRYISPKALQGRLNRDAGRWTRVASRVSFHGQQRVP